MDVPAGLGSIVGGRRWETAAQRQKTPQQSTSPRPVGCGRLCTSHRGRASDTLAHQPHKHQAATPVAARPQVGAAWAASHNTNTHTHPCNGAGPSNTTEQLRCSMCCTTHTPPRHATPAALCSEVLGARHLPSAGPSPRPRSLSASQAAPCGALSPTASGRGASHRSPLSPARPSATEPRHAHCTAWGAG